MANLENLKDEDIKSGTERIILKLKNEKINENILKKTIKEYEETLDVTSVLTKKLNYKIMIPFSKIAFFEGQVKYTNNIYQDIGCNTFCERTSEQAHNYLKKKLNFYKEKYKIVSNSINKLTKELELSLELTHAIKLEDQENKNNSFIRPDGFLEIREEYNESDESDQNYSQNLKNETNNSPKTLINNKNKLNIDQIKNINCDLKCYDHDQIKREDIKMNPQNCENKNTQNQKETNQDVNTLINQTTPKSLNVNKQGLLNISERYISSSESSEAE
ncbi:hypothetical protein YYC_02690 [Plasmodium yoelii 17X]|uniref:Prefoldin, alpha subunit n=1 Tax=Plasmodium yoelii 17X TaxID=1323249 RepID=V7PPY6_PLAYE|nr:hypothetical protein YYC_02690 [Plasmodium yoelii 17X]